jgi:hypothetical protein
MATILNADTVVGGAIVTGDASGVLQLQAGGNAGLTINSTQAVGVGSSPSYGTSGQALVSSGSGAAPTWSAVGVPGGGTGLATATAYALLTGGTTSTGNFQQVSGTGTSGQVLTSNGAGALPTWQTSSGITTGKAIAMAIVFGG